MARYNFEKVELDLSQPDEGFERKISIQPKELDLPWRTRLLLWIVRPIVRRILEWAEDSVLQLLTQIGASEMVREATAMLFGQLRRLLDEGL